MRQSILFLCCVVCSIICTVTVAGEAVPAAPLVPAMPPVQIGEWSMGPGTIAGSAAQAQQSVLTGQVVASSNDVPARFNFHAPVAGHVTMGPGAALSLKIETRADQQILVMEIERGSVQVQLDNKGNYSVMQVRGGAMELNVTGTLFVVERVRRDADYVALIKGKLKVSLRKEVADTLGKADQRDIDSRQGMGASSGGLSGPDALNNRPQITGKSGKSVQEQGTGPQDGDGGWDYDEALELLIELLKELGLDDELIKQLIDSLGDALFEDLNSGPGDQAVNTVLGAAGALSSPPPPPPR
jgi:hypothetical protein